MDVTSPEQARIAEAAGACAVMALERIPADIRAAGGVSRMSDPKMIKGIQDAVSIPVMAKCRIGHFVEAQLLEAIEIDYIDESEVLSPADDVIINVERSLRIQEFQKVLVSIVAKKISMGITHILIDLPYGKGSKVERVDDVSMLDREFRKLFKK